MKPIIGFSEIRGAKIIDFQADEERLCLLTDKGAFILLAEVCWLEHDYAVPMISIPCELNDDIAYHFSKHLFDSKEEYQAWTQSREETEAREQLENDKRQLEYAEKQVEVLKRKIKVATHLTK